MAKIRGGTKLDAALKRIAGKLGRGGKVKVGFLKGATYPDAKSTPVAAVAAWNNWGTSKIPPRPFFSNMVKDKSPSWPAAIEANLKATDYDTNKTLELAGEGIAGQLRQSIVDLKTPPNAPSTISRKGFDDPLVDSGHMLKSVDKEVVV
jgi:hypothetical protein